METFQGETFQGVYRLKHHEPKDKSSGPILLVTFEKSHVPSDAVKLMRFFGRQVKATIVEEENRGHNIEAEFKVIKAAPKIHNKLPYFTFTLSTPYINSMAVEVVNLWDKECIVRLQEIQQELPLEHQGEEDTENQELNFEGEGE